MSHSLTSTLAVARQQFDELLVLVPLDRLRALDLGEGAKRIRIDALLESLTKGLTAVEVALGHGVDDPVKQIPLTHITFFHEALEPNASVIRRAYWETIGLRELFESLHERTENNRSSAVRSAIEWGLERWLDMLDEDEIADWAQRGFAIPEALEMVGLPLFDPDLWQENMRLLRPVLVDRPPQHLRNHIRQRLNEIYRAFTFGLWMSCIALCRSLLEYALKECAPRYAIETTRLNARGFQEERSLKEICDDFSGPFPALASAFETVRDSGNRVMHAKKRDVIAFPKILRDEAIDCIRSTRAALESVYSQASSQLGPNNPR